MAEAELLGLGTLKFVSFLSQHGESGSLQGYPTSKLCHRRAEERKPNNDKADTQTSCLVHVKSVVSQTDGTHTDPSGEGKALARGRGGGAGGGGGRHRKEMRPRSEGRGFEA